jgi:ubiquinol-cytochrome c reductase cytochrome b subunit
MFSAILVLITLPFTDLSRSRGIQFRPISKIAFYIFLGNFLMLLQLGAKHVESPFIELGQISTLIYFMYFLILIPLISLLENSLIELESEIKIFNNNKFSSFNIIKSSTKYYILIFISIYSYFNITTIYCDVPSP